MTERMFNIILASVITFLLGCAVFFYVTEDKAKPVASQPENVIDSTPPPSTPTDNKDTSPPASDENENQPKNEEPEGNNNNENEEKSQNKNDKSKDMPEIVWGIDSASETSGDFYACVKDNFGDPGIIGRYLGDREDISKGLTSEQIEIIHGEGDFILPIYNHFNDATGYDNGVAHAKEAIKIASDLGILEGVALFADIEPDYPVDSEFIKGWFDTISESQYKSGIYGVFDPEHALFEAYNAAVESNKSILENNYIWTAAPSVGITVESEAPEFKPAAPEGSLAWGWQYGLDADTCNIDTNLFKSELVNVLWGPKN
ncbi:glycoside hydrolase domain-containing protein [Fredinandcohnia sp. 179-A 10B2 NHS]|uniref:glycoside hydrolase domain-containing protein n=1 Tax=Fredinandcohnia sp. 179-A 10B2 NHS TaxID=3235176 RepID=UPI0039A1E51B